MNPVFARQIHKEVTMMCNFDCSTIWQILSQLCGFTGC